MPEVYCGARVDGGLCLHEESIHADTLDVGGPADHAFNCGCSAFIPAYVRCPECYGDREIRPGWVRTGMYDADPCPRCTTTPTPGFIPVSEEVRT